jgi:hypothetical protein
MIDRDLAAFLEGGLSILFGTRNDRLEPNGIRATAVRAHDDGRHLVVYLPEVAAGQVLPDLESNGQAAVVFCRITDDRTYQVKGEFVEARAATPGEREFVTAQWERFLANLEAVGFPPASTGRWSTWPSIGIRIRATALFDQTPGPRAGAALA